MKLVEEKTDEVLLGVFALSMAVYIVIFAAAFAELPISIPPWHQFLLLSFHIIQFCLQLLLYRLAKPRWRLLVSVVLLMAPGVVFLRVAGWTVMGWILSLYWCAALVLGCVFTWTVWLMAWKK